MNNNKRAVHRIGVIDSGIGGMSTLRGVLEILQSNANKLNYNLEFVYVGDNLNNPYGERSKEEINQFVDKILNFLKSKNVNMLIVACNTMCSNAMETIIAHKFAYTVNVVDACVSAIIQAGSKNIGVIATSATVRSNHYPNVLKEIMGDDVSVVQEPSPNLAKMIERRELDADGLLGELDKHVQSLLKANNKIETICLACTHYQHLDHIRYMSLYYNDINRFNVALPYDEIVRLLLEGKLITESTENNEQNKIKIDVYATEHTDNFWAMSQSIFNIEPVVVSL